MAAAPSSMSAPRRVMPCRREKRLLGKNGVAAIAFPSRTSSNIQGLVRFFVFQVVIEIVLQVIFNVECLLSRRIVIVEHKGDLEIDAIFIDLAVVADDLHLLDPDALHIAEGLLGAFHALLDCVVEALS
jgi:hypothetical protein